MTRHVLPRRGTAMVAAALTTGLTMWGLAGQAAAATTSTAPAPPLVDPHGLNLGQWMSQIRNVIGDRPLNKVVMPGSHDAGSWSITPDSGVCDTA
ncbi:hypothetical protein, partial [Streptomyces sp. NPDC093223]|uniref:hypothetical protein n=1 Tax=Streptomyces sp. NPDC093223 TaxID=3366033 RepID=UPI0038246011